MKIDYELVKNIGATHYSEKRLRKFNRDGEMFAWDFDDCKWINATATCEWIANNVKQIPQQKPTRTKVEYVKVNKSIFDLKEEFDRGRLFHNECVIRSATALAECYAKDEIYRRIETPITDRDEFIEKVMIDHFNKSGLTSEIVGEMFDAGCRFVGE